MTETPADAEWYDHTVGFLSRVSPKGRGDVDVALGARARIAIGAVVAALTVPLGATSMATAKEVDQKGAGTVANEVNHKAPAANVGTKFAWHRGRSAHLLWTGFRAQHDGGEVLVQTSSEVELETRESNDGPVFVLKGCRVLRRTDELPLETRFFSSPVTRVSVKQRAGDLEIAVSLRQAVTAVPRKEAGPDGSWFWVLAFPAAADASRTTAAATP